MTRSSEKVAVTSRSFSNHPQLRKELLEAYPNVTFNESGVSLQGDALIRFLEGHEKAIVALERIDDSVLGALPELKVISKYGVGLDALDLEAFNRRNVHLGWTAGVNRRAVAELALTMAIMALRRIPESYHLVRNNTWKQISGRQLTAKTVGIIGCGNIGKDLVELLKPFNCTLLAHDIVDYSDYYREYKISAVSLEELLQRSDVVTLHVPYNPSTKNILSRERLESMKRGSVLINSARGGLVDEEALQILLKSGSIAGAAFDVFANEPTINRGLLDLPNFFCTSHIGGSAEEAVLAMGRAAIVGLSENRIP